jgi:hypothetical protein
MHPEKKKAIQRRDRLQRTVNLMEKLAQASAHLTAEERALLDQHTASLRVDLQAAEKRVTEKSSRHYCTRLCVLNRAIGDYTFYGTYTTEKDLNGDFWADVRVSKLEPPIGGIQFSSRVETVEKVFKTRKAAGNYALKQAEKLVEKYGKKARPKGRKRAAKPAPKKAKA